MTLRILRRPEVMTMTGLRRTRLDDLERRGDFPRRIRISDRAVGYRSDEVETWIASRPRADEVGPDRGGDVYTRKRSAPIKPNEAA